MKLKKLLDGLDIKVVKGSKEIEIVGLSSNSKEVGHGFLYIAKRGGSHDGNHYVSDAILAGAVAILSDLYNPFLEGVTQLIAKDTTAVESAMAARFYDKPHEKLFLIGITGTNGKTTTSYLVRHLLGDAGLMGTIECIIGEHRIKSALTTPDCITCYKRLKEMVSEKLESAVMEVSSHALQQNRVEGILFDVALFTNLSPEHLDYHKDMEEYGESKRKLFSKLKKSGVAIVNADDPKGKWMAPKALTYGIDTESDFRATDIRMTVSGIRFTLRGEAFELPLVGKFNVYNALAAIAVAHVHGVPMETIRERLKTFPAVPGRLQRVVSKKGSHIFVDFAHKTEALRNVLMTLSELKQGRIITLFGCGGNRDCKKRPQMARVAEEYSDRVIVTSDNPRGEDPLEIIREIEIGFQGKNYQIEMDRAKAIALGISLLEKGDILLIAGKGHETNQIFANRTVVFDDVKVARELANAVS